MALEARLCLTCQSPLPPKSHLARKYCCRPCWRMRPRKVLFTGTLEEQARKRASAWYYANKERALANAKRSTQANPERTLAAKRKHQIARYGLTVEEFNSIAQAQQGVCAICCRPPKFPSLSIDHCHETNKFRGLLCEDCNHGLGHFRDNIEVMQAAIVYLERSRA